MVSRLSLLMQEVFADLSTGRRQRSLELIDAALDLVESNDDPELLHTLGRDMHAPLFSIPGMAARAERFARIASREERHGPSPLMVSSLAMRSEEHTSELQSHLNLVCRLLLEKKKNTTY